MKWRAFTLIELLVVIGIITILAAIMVPILGYTRQLSRALRCGSNLKQIGISLINHDTSKGNFPYSFYHSTGETMPPGGYTGDFKYDYPGWRWFNYITEESRNELETKSLFWCPSRKMDSKLFKYNMLFANYGVNEAICKNWVTYKKNEFSGQPLSSEDVQRPGETLLAADSGYSVINWYHVTDSPPSALGNSIEDHSYIPGLTINKKRNLFPEQQEDAIYGRHIKKSVNICFVDGHVSRQKAEDLFVEKTSDGYSNLSPLWLPKKKNQ